MAQSVTNTQHYQDIANAIRVKTGKTDTFRPSEMASEILGITTATESWVRPSGLPDYSQVDISDQEVLYMTYDTQCAKRASNFISVVITGSATTVEWGTLSNGVFTAAGSANLASGNTYRATLPTNLGRYVVYRIKPSGSTHISRYYLNTSDITIASQRISAFRQPLVEVYCRLPYLTNISSYLVSTHTISFTHYGAISPTSMANSFQYGYVLERVYFDALDTQLCTSFNSTFYNCYRLKHYDLNLVVTDKCTTLNGMFYCNRLIKRFPFNMQSWDVSNVTTLANTFSGCSSLTSLNIGSWNVGKVTSFATTFNACSQLTDLDVSSWSAPQCTSVQGMFTGCASITEIDLSHIGSSLITTVYNLFNNCMCLKKVNVTNLVKSQCTDMRSAFSNCYALLDIIGLSTWNTSGVTQAASCFYNIASMSELDLSQLDLSGITTLANTASFMRYCTELEKLTLPSTLHYCGQYFVSDTKQIREYHFLGSTPPSLYSATLFPKYTGMKMYVPVGSLSAYQNAWSGYVSYLEEEGT